MGGTIQSSQTIVRTEMEVIKDNVNGSQSTERTVECEHCGSILKISKSDISFGALGCGFFNCPCCGKESYIDGYDLYLTADTVRFPQHYNHTSTPHALHMDDDMVNRMVADVTSALIKDSDEVDFVTSACGDVWIMGKQGEENGEIDIVVTRDFYETTINY